MNPHVKRIVFPLLSHFGIIRFLTFSTTTFSSLHFSFENEKIYSLLCNNFFRMIIFHFFHKLEDAVQSLLCLLALILLSRPSRIISFTLSLAF